MPIRPENRDRYPDDWQEISRRVRFERAEGRCECTGECGRRHTYDRCMARHGEAHPVTDSIVVLTVAHMDHTPENNDDANLRAMCQRCHNSYDSASRAEGVKRRAREAIEEAGQGVLFEPLDPDDWPEPEVTENDGIVM